MGFKRRVIGAGLALSLTAGAGLGYEMVQENRLSDTLTPVSSLPEENSDPPATLICTAEFDPTTNPCKRQDAIDVYADKTSTHLTLAEIRPIDDQKSPLEEALVAAEDHTFYTHKGVNDKRSIAAALKSAQAGEVVAGGSTITQSLVDVLYPDASENELKESAGGAERIISSGFRLFGKERLADETLVKTNEMRRALYYEQHHTKDEIMEKALNTFYFGRGVYGVADASMAYFGIPAWELTEEQALWLTGLLSHPRDMDVDIQDPNDPNTRMKYDKEMAVGTENFLENVDAAEDLKFISREKAKQFRLLVDGVPDNDLRPDSEGPILIPFVPKSTNNFTGANELGARYYVDRAVEETATKLGITSAAVQAGGFVIYTNLERKAQEAMLAAVNSDPITANSSIRAAGIAVREDGRIIAESGGDYSELQFNFTRSSNRHLGSIIKVVHAAMEETIRNGKDEPYDAPAKVVFPAVPGRPEYVVQTGNHCKDIGKVAPCTETLDEFLGLSDNTAAAEIIRKRGSQTAVEFLGKLGIKADPVPSIALGSVGVPLDRITNIFQAFLLNDGVMSENYAVKAIVKGATITPHATKPGQQVIHEKISHKLTSALKATLQRGTGAGAFDPPHGTDSVVLKTGTVGAADGSTGNTDVLTAGAMCDVESDDKKSDIAFAFRIGDPNSANTAMNITSKRAVAMSGKFLIGMAAPGVTCDIVR